MGRLGKSSLADAADCSNLPDALLTILASALALIFVTGAEGKKKCPLAPVSLMAVLCRSVVVYELGGLQVVAVDSKDKLVFSATASTGPISHLVSHPLFFVDPPMMLSLVAQSLCPCSLLVHVLLECPFLTQYPCVQQYLLR
jgi:hypothetical protein